MLVVDSPQPSSSVPNKPTFSMPFVRRKRIMSCNHRQNQIEARGEAWLCFAKDHSWFQGNISTDDESNYSLYGEKRRETPPDTSTVDLIEDQLIDLDISSSSEDGDESGKIRRDSRSSTSTESSVEFSSDDSEEQNNNMKKNPGSKLVNSASADEYYNVILTDHFSGLRYQLPRIYVNQEDEDESKSNNLFVCADGLVSFQVEKVFKGQKADMMIQQYIGSPSLLGQKCLVYHGPMSIIFDELMTENGRSWCL